MSMLSSQIDELRKWADQLSERENEFGVVVRALVAALRDAADTIWQLRDDLQRANSENAKLRELIKDMFTCISHANEQDWFYFERDKAGCGLSCTANGEGCGLSVLASRMGELGVEVEQ